MIFQGLTSMIMSSFFKVMNDPTHLHYVCTIQPAHHSELKIVQRSQFIRDTNTSER